MLPPDEMNDRYLPHPPYFPDAMLNGLAPELEAKYFPLDSLRRSPLNFVSWGSGGGRAGAEHSPQVNTFFRGRGLVVKIHGKDVRLHEESWKTFGKTYVLHKESWKT